jgi:SHS2 domain-containing protein
MKWVLIDKFDNIVHTVDLNKRYTQEEAQRYFVNLKQISYENFIQIWKVMPEESYQVQLKLSLKNRQIEWWNDDDYLDIDR